MNKPVNLANVNHLGLICILSEIPSQLAMGSKGQISPDDWK